MYSFFAAVLISFIGAVSVLFSRCLHKPLHILRVVVSFFQPVLTFFVSDCLLTPNPYLSPDPRLVAKPGQAPCAKQGFVFVTHRI